MEPATHEVLGPSPHLLCEEHARYLAQSEDEQDWLESEDPEEYARSCEDAASQLYRLEGETENSVLLCILEGARAYLELYELRRARENLKEKKGGKPELVESEKEYLRFKRDFEEKHGISN